MASASGVSNRIGLSILGISEARMRCSRAGSPWTFAVASRAFQHHVAEVHRRPLALGIGEVPPADVGQGRGGAVGVLQLVDANGDLVLAGLEDDRHFDARAVVRAAGVEDVQSRA